MDPTESRIRDLCADAGIEPRAVAPLAGDVGRRRYFRVSASGASVIAVVYPDGEEEACRRWNRVRAALAPRVRVPRVLAEETGGGAQILDDFGDASLSRLWSDAPGQRPARHADAARTAAAIASTVDPAANPPFSAEFFAAELERSQDAFFGALARDPLTAGERAVHDEFAKEISTEIAAHPRVLLHRDFHVDNLFAAGESIGVIDFQDARLGPDSYDVASLVGERAALVAPESAAAEAAIEAYCAEVRPLPGFRKRLGRVALQRGWKAAGTFARVCAEGRADAYAAFLRPQLAAVARGLSREGVEAEFAAILHRRSVKLFGEEAPC